MVNPSWLLTHSKDSMGYPFCVEFTVSHQQSAPETLEYEYQSMYGQTIWGKYLTAIFLTNIAIEI